LQRTEHGMTGRRPQAASLYTATASSLNWTLYWGGNIGYSWGEVKRDFTVIGVGTASGSEDIDGVTGGF
jgi:hypothetical protein